MQINKYNIRKNIKIVDHYDKVGDKVVITNNAAYKYGTPYNGPSLIAQCWTNGMVTLQYGPKQIRYNIRRIKPYTYDTNWQNTG